MSHERAAPRGRKINLKNLYHLDFVPAEEFFQPRFYESLFTLLDKENVQSNFDDGHLPCKQVINPKYHSFNNLDWTDGSVIVFWATSIIPIPIHCDIDSRYEEFGLGNGVNFNLFNSSVVNFYDMQDLTQVKSGSMGLTNSMTEQERVIVENYNKSTAKAYETHKPPVESYEIGANETYIINTTVPHQLLAQPGRICVSVRLRQFNMTPWSLMVDYFKQSIKL